MSEEKKPGDVIPMRYRCEVCGGDGTLGSPRRATLAQVRGMEVFRKMDPYSLTNLLPIVLLGALVLAIEFAVFVGAVVIGTLIAHRIMEKRKGQR